MKSIFAEDVKKGLSSQYKYLSSKYFYDIPGSLLFNEITRHPDYYLTSCELEILNSNCRKIVSMLPLDVPLNLIELGPGEGLKAGIFIEEFLKTGHDFVYYIIDISEEYVNNFKKKIHKIYPDVKIKTLHSDFLNGLKMIENDGLRKNFLLFLGSSIGNFHPDESVQFFQEIRSHLKEGDYFLTGFDLIKDQQILMKAYADGDQLTKAFNLNLLTRINRELSADFDITQFDHVAKYNSRIEAMESYLVSTCKQTVNVEKINKTFSFKKGECIHTENSYKYHLGKIATIGNDTGFQVVDNFFDERNYFVNSLWVAHLN